MYISILGFPGGPVVKNLPAMQELRVRSRAQAIYSSILAWRIPWTEKPGRLQSVESQRVGHDWRDLACTCAWSLRELPPAGFCFPGFSASLSSLRILQSLFEIYYKNIRVLWLLFWLFMLTCHPDICFNVSFV